MTFRHIAITSIAAEAVRVELCGEIDGACAGELTERTSALVTSGAHLEIDLSHTTFLDTDGAAPLLHAAEAARARGDELCIVAWSPATEHLRDALTLVCASQR